MQAYVHGDARRSENAEPHGHQHDGWRLYTRPRVNPIFADPRPFT